MKKINTHFKKTFKKISILTILAFFTLGISIALAGPADSTPGVPGGTPVPGAPGAPGGGTGTPPAAPAGGTPAGGAPAPAPADKENFRSFNVSKYLTVNDNAGMQDKPCENNSTDIGVQCQTYLKSTNPTASFILQMINFVVTMVGSLAFFAIVYGGFTYVISAGNDNQLNKAKDIITKAITGLVITLSAYFIIAFVQGLLFETVK